MSIAFPGIVEVAHEGIHDKVPEEGRGNISLGHSGVCVNLGGFPKWASDTESVARVNVFHEFDVFFIHAIASKDGPDHSMIDAAVRIGSVNEKGV